MHTLLFSPVSPLAHSVGTIGRDDDYGGAGLREGTLMTAINLCCNHNQTTRMLTGQNDNGDGDGDIS